MRTQQLFAEKLIEENQWLPKAIELIGHRLVSRGFNINNDWLGYYDEYALHYIPSECGEWGIVEIHSKRGVFNPYKFVGGDGYEYEKLGEFDIYDKQWEVIKEYIIWTGKEIDGKKVCFDDPYYERPRFIGGSDVPINGYYE